MRRISSLVRVGALGAALLFGSAVAQTFTPPAHDFHVASAGKYAIDPAHTAVIAYVSHVGFSNEAFRFLKVNGELAWDPNNPAADALTVTVDPKSIATADTGATDFAAELQGEKFLNSAKFAAASFVSHRFRPTDASHGFVDGDLTIMGHTHPAMFNVELIGAGPEFGRWIALGVHAETQINPNDYGLAPPFFTLPIKLVIDTEFHKPVA